MEAQRLSFALMLSYLNRVVEGVEEPRQRSNAQRYGRWDLRCCFRSLAGSTKPYRLRDV
jgi:hypothetical protein